MPTLNDIISIIQENSTQQQLVKLVLSASKIQSDLKKIIIQPVVIKQKQQLSFVYRYTTKDITKNYFQEEALKIIAENLTLQFTTANLLTTTKQFSFIHQKSNWKIIELENQQTLQVNLAHDNTKPSLFTKTDFLQHLGILNDKGLVLKDKGAKYKQIKKFVEIVGGLINKHPFNKKDTIQIYDMGCGKAYLTFALYDYLNHTVQQSSTITGIESRADLAAHNNQLAQQINFSQLSFQQGFIADFEVPQLDILIALHACNTATDDAIYKAIKANTAIIIVAPCCHKEIRQQITTQDLALQAILKHGILAERQAEMLTDTIRALLLEIHGYKTKVFEFISTEHTAKNVMITAEKRQQKTDITNYKTQLAAIKHKFQIKTQHLEQLLKNV